jgi:hypothetical protein
MLNGNLIFAGELTKLAQSSGMLLPYGGMLLKSSPQEEVKPWCTVALTRADTVLTAFHCITSLHAGDTLKVFFPYEGIREVDLGSIEPFCTESEETVRPDEPTGCSTWVDDLTVLSLSEPYDFLRPAQLGPASSTYAGSTGIISGFGFQGDSYSKYGLKHEGDVLLIDCNPADATSVADTVNQSRELCFQFSRSNPADTVISPIDSGAPMFIEAETGGARELVGIARGSQYIEGGDPGSRIARFVNLTHPFYQRWLSEKAFSPHPMSVTGTPAVLIRDATQVLGSSARDDYPLTIHESTQRLLMTLAHEPGAAGRPIDLDLQLPDSLEASCERHASVEVCSVENPQAGTYRISVGWGTQCEPDGNCVEPVYDVAYQMTAIALYDNPSAPQGGTPETGNE